jgi:hypothetical protein
VVKGCRPLRRVLQVRRNGEPMHVRAILRYKRLGRYVLVAVTEQSSHNHESRFTTKVLTCILKNKVNIFVQI